MFKKRKDWSALSIDEKVHTHTHTLTRKLILLLVLCTSKKDLHGNKMFWIVLVINFKIRKPVSKKILIIIMKIKIWKITSHQEILINGKSNIGN
jgi:hypothetical protein